MANHVAIYAFAESLRTFLHDSHAAHKPGLPAATFEVLSSGRFSSTNETINDGTVTLYLHRVTHNNHLRNTRIGPPVGPLGLDLHFLLTVWGSKPDDEYTLLGWAMRELHYHAFLDASSLTTPTNAAQWAVDEVVSIVPADMNPEEMARIWEAAHRGYRLSYPFIARIVRLGIDKTPTGEPVVAQRFTFTDDVEETVP
jgi:hypothetical protein